MSPENLPERESLYQTPRIPCSAEYLKAVSTFAIPWSTYDAAWATVGESLKLLNIPDQTGGANPGDRRALFYLISHFRPQAVLEIGTHIGASTTHIAVAMNNYAAKKFVTVDIADVNNALDQPWTKFGSGDSPLNLLARLGAQSLVEFRQSTGVNSLRNETERFDLIFLDGDHHAAPTYTELALALGRLNQGGVILLHDYFPNMEPLWHGSKPIVGPFLAGERIMEECPEVRVVPLGELPWPTKMGTSLTSLAMVVKHS